MINITVIVAPLLHLITMDGTINLYGNRIGGGGVFNLIGSTSSLIAW